LQVAERAVALFERLGQLDTIVAASMRSDLQVARLMAEAGARGAVANVEINLEGLTDAAVCRLNAHEDCSTAGASGQCSPERQERRLRVPPCPIRKEHEMRLTMNSGVTPTRRGSTIRQTYGCRHAGGNVPGDAEPARAGRLGADIIALFPKEIGEFAYADLKKARTLKWFPQLQEQMLPDRFRQFEKFLASAGVDPNSQVDELAWGLVAEGISAKTERRGIDGRFPQEKKSSAWRWDLQSKFDGSFLQTAKARHLPKRAGVTRCMRSGPVRERAICSSFSLIRIPRRLGIAPFWKR